MHSGDRLTGQICKCMNCAQQRNERLLRHAERNYPTLWTEMRAKAFKADDLEKEARLLRAEVNARKRELTSIAREDLTA